MYPKAGRDYGSLIIIRLIRISGLKFPLVVGVVLYKHMWLSQIELLSHTGTEKSQLATELLPARAGAAVSTRPMAKELGKVLIRRESERTRYRRTPVQGSQVGSRAFARDGSRYFQTDVARVGQEHSVHTNTGIQRADS